MKVLLAILTLAVIGAPLFVVVGLATAIAIDIYTSNTDLWMVGQKTLAPIEQLMGKDTFLAIPLFVATGSVMTEGGMARRLVEFMRALLGWLPGGLGMASVVACMMFAAISGSSPVTLIAVGSIMFPAMVKGKYPENFSLGLVMTAGSLGCLVAPSLILTIYALAVATAGQAKVEVEEMWMAAYVPAAALALILCAYSFVVGLRHGEREVFSGRKLYETFRDGVWSLALPVIVYLGISRGFFPPFKAGAVAFVYALVVTTLVHRELDVKKLFGTLGEAARLMGMLILIIALTFSLNQLFADVELSERLAGWLKELDLGPIGFLLLVNVFLIVIGALMDSVSATVIFAPILARIAVEQYGIDPVHFGIVFVVNMEIGYLAPPVATNLFVAAALFKKPFGQVARAILPGLAITCAALVMFMFVPTCSKGLPNLQRTGELSEVWQPFPWDGQPKHAVRQGADVFGEITGETADEAINDEEINEKSAEDYYFGDEGEDDPTAVEPEGEDEEEDPLAEDEDAGDAGAAAKAVDAGAPADAGAAADEEEEEEEEEGEDFDDVQL